MATKYSDIIALRGQKAAYNIQTEEDGAWKVFIANEQFNDILRRIINSVYNNDTNVHKSFWIEGTYGTGKSHAAAVIKHLLCDDVAQIADYVNEEYANPKFDALRQSLFDLRKQKRLFPVTMYGQNNIAHKDDLSLQMQREIKLALSKAGLDLDVKTDFDNYVSHIQNNRAMWELILQQNPKLSSFTPTVDKLLSNLVAQDSGTLGKVKDVLRDAGIDIRLESEKLSSWFFEVEEKLAQSTDYDGLLVIWDEFTDVMKSDIGLSLLVDLQRLADETMNAEHNSYLFFISHPSALNSLKAEERDKTKGRYLYMKYNMEPVSAFKIMSRKFKLVGSEDELRMVSSSFFDKCAPILNAYTAGSASQAETIADIKNLFPLHPATANLATYYAREAGASSRSVFQFLGENEAVKAFLDNENFFMNRETITADYLWDYVVTEFNDNVAKFGAVTERFNSYRLRVEHESAAHLAVFKGILLLNALNNIANNESVTPSEDNIKSLFVGTSIEYQVDDILTWLNDNSIIQRAPGGMYSIQFSALPPKEIEEIKKQLMFTEFKTTAQVINFGYAAREDFDRYLANVARPYSFQFYSTEVNEYTLLNKVENGRKQAKDYELFFAMMVARNAEELNTLKDICLRNCNEERFQTTTFVVFDTTLTDLNYQRFIEYQANAKCAQQHGFADQQQSHAKCASDMLKEWIKEIRRGVFVTYVKGQPMTASAMKMPTVVNSEIAPAIFSAGPESLDIIKIKFSKTYWKKALVKDTVKSVISFNTKTDISDHCKGPAMHVPYLLQDSVDENLRWKTDVDPAHPLYQVCKFVENKIKHADKSNTFNLAEKFIDLKCRLNGFKPNCVVLVATIRALKLNGGADDCDLATENLNALKNGLPNLMRHLNAITDVYKLPCVVTINRFITDTDAEIELVRTAVGEKNVACVINEVWAKGGTGALNLARAVIDNCNKPNDSFSFAYDLDESVKDKIFDVAHKIYGAKSVVYTEQAEKSLKNIHTLGLDGLPVIMAKTQFSFTDDAKRLGAPTDFELTVRDVEIRSGAGFLVVLLGNMMLMPALSASPAAIKMTIDENEHITGLF